MLELLLSQASYPLQLLLDKGAVADTRNDDDQTALDLATTAGHAEAIRLLQEKVPKIEVHCG
jgi:ankyrin repeat protein